MANTTRLNKEEFMVHRKSFDTNKYKVDNDIYELVSEEGNPEALFDQLDPLEVEEIAKSRRIPVDAAQAYVTWLDSERGKDDHHRLVQSLKGLCSAPILLGYNTALWCDVLQNPKWCDFNHTQEDGYDLDGDDFTDIGTGALFNEDEFLDRIAGVASADEEDD